MTTEAEKKAAAEAKAKEPKLEIEVVYRCVNKCYHGGKLFQIGDIRKSKPVVTKNGKEVLNSNFKAVNRPVV